MPIIRAARRAAWRACGLVGAAVLASLAAFAVLVAADQRARRKAEDAQFDAEIRALLGGRR
jgi:hypothetical protein